MKIQTLSQPTFTRPSSAPVASQQLPQDRLTLVEPPPPGYNPKAPVPGGQWILGGAAALTIGALGAYAGLNSGAGAVLAGSLAGGIAGGVGLGAVGLMADLGGGFMSSSKGYTQKAALVGGTLGAVGGGLVGALSNNPWAAGALAIAGGVGAGLITTAWANENLPK